MIWNLRLTEFRKILFTLDQVLNTKISIFEDAKHRFKSKRLQQLCTFRHVAEAPPAGVLGNQDTNMNFDLEDEDGLFDNYTPILKPFQACIDWEHIENDRFMPRPIKGMDREIDDILDRMDAIKRRVQECLQEARNKFNCDKITLASNRKYRFNLEVPNEFSEKIEKDDTYFVTTRLKSCKRFLSSELSNLTTELVQEEVIYKARISPLIRDMFERFYQFRDHWTSSVRCMAELDALQALAQVSAAAGMTKPLVHSFDRPPLIKIHQMRHPLLDSDDQCKFIANDLHMNFESQRTILITGPNMGGKSTLLRTTCLVIIMAQIGCFVPAEFCELTAVDHIFTRVGATDKILENKSTFYLELEETKIILDKATEHSLIIMDELGRGTSTFDGYSLAKSVLNYLLNVNRSQVLFTTHYHWLVDDFRH